MLWFKHDSNAHRDAKLKKVIIKYGLSGYGLYWFLLEEIANGITPTKFTFQIESDAEIISHDTGISVQLVSEMLAYMVDLKLFENNSGIITCLKMLNRLDSSMTSNSHMRNIITKAKSANSHDGIMTVSCKNRVDKITLDKNKEKSSRFAPPSIEELTNYINENQLSIDANDFINFYESKNWMVGKNKMKDWKASARGWHSRNNKKGKENEQSGDKPKTASARFMENMRNTWND